MKHGKQMGLWKDKSWESPMVFISSGNITMCLVNVISLPGPTLYICHGIGLKDKHADNPSFMSWEITSFPVDFPSNQSIGSIVDEYLQFNHVHMFLMLFRPIDRSILD